MDAATAIQFIAKDEAFLLELFYQLDQLKLEDRGAIQNIVERYIVQSLAGDDGYLKPGALTNADLDAMQEELFGIYSDDALENHFNEMVGLVDLRLANIDDLMLELELTDGILGDAVFEMETVQNQITNIGEGLIRGRDGEGDYKGSLERIEESMNQYRFNRNKSEFTLREEFMDTLVKDAGAGVNHANSVAVTSMATIDRQLRRVQSTEAGTTHGIYAGPFDNVIRPFCDDWLGQVMTWDFWDSLRNDMPVGLFDYPASIYGGGINCRHRIIAWVLDWEDGETDLRRLYAASFRSRFLQLSPEIQRWALAS